MGVKGLYTLLSNEPSRFGYQWSSIDPSNSIDIYIDAPALHHHLIHSFQKGSDLPLSFHKNDFEDHPFNGIVSPCTIYKLTRAFILQLRRALRLRSTSIGNINSSKVIFVFDGVASIYKEEQQAVRIKENCIVYDAATRSYLKGEERKKRYHSTHLFSEDAMIEAVEFEAEASKSVNTECEIKVEVYFARSEAEVFIANLISQTSSQPHTPRRQSDNNNKRKRSCDHQARKNIVLSNDSDFLVYPSVPGFIPLHSLEFKLDEEGNTIMKGWLYSRTKFLAAYPLLKVDKDDNDINIDESLHLSSTMAALAGCDYILSPHLQQRINSARQIIVNSNIGGLRPRDRRNPTAKSRLLAVLRYISHFHQKQQSRRWESHGDNTSSGQGAVSDHWMMQMSNCITRAERRFDIDRQESLIAAFNAIKDIYDGKLGNNLDDTSCACPNKMVGLRRLLLHRTLYLKPVMESLGEAGTRRKDERNRHKAKRNLQKCINRSGSGGSVWMNKDFVNFRDRLYSYLAGKDTTFHGVDETKCSVSEYCRTGSGTKTACYECFHVDLPKPNYFQSAELLAALVTDKFPQEVESCVDQLHHKVHIMLFLVVMLLDKKRDVLLFLMISLVLESSSSERAGHCEPKDSHNPIDVSKRKEYLHSSGRILVAFFHAKLSMDVIDVFDDQLKRTLEAKEVQVYLCHSTFCNTRTAALWSNVSDYDTLDVDNQNILSTLVEEVDRVLHLNISSQGSFDHINKIWRTWQTVKGGN